MDVHTGFYTVERTYAYSESLPLAVSHESLSEAQDWACLLSEDMGVCGWVDVVADGRLVAVWRRGAVTLMTREPKTKTA